MVALVFLPMFGSATGAPASAATPKVLRTSQAPSSFTWLAAGDSYSSGEGLPHNDGTACQRANGLNGRTSLAWPEVAANILHKDGGLSSSVSPDLVACSGATTADFFGSQWNSQKSDLVTFSFGGDDVHFASVMEHCLSIGCPPDSSVRSQIKSFASTERTFLTRVAKKAVVNGGNVVVLGYPEIFELPKFWAKGTCDGRISRQKAALIRGWAGDLNATIAEAVDAVNSAHPNHVTLTYVDVNTGNPSQGISYTNPDLFEPASGTRHNLCSANSWINGITHVDHTNASFHPKQSGQNAMGALAAMVIGNLNWANLAPEYQLSLDTLCSGSGVANDSVNGCPYDGTTRVGNQSFTYMAYVSSNYESVHPAYWDLLNFPATTCSFVSVHFAIPNDGGQLGDTAFLRIREGAITRSASVLSGNVGSLQMPLTGRPWRLYNSATSDTDQIAISLSATCASPNGL